MGLAEFNDQIWDSVKKEEFVEVTDEVRELHQGIPFSVQLMNYVHKVTSSSTKLRVISNSSISRVGGSLNENICCGVNSMNLVINVLNRWSCYGYCLLTDLSSAYTSVRKKPKTNSVRRLYWFKEPGDASTMTELMVVRCNFGDRCAGRVLDLCNIRISDDTQISEPTRDFLRLMLMMGQPVHRT